MTICRICNHSSLLLPQVCIICDVVEVDGYGIEIEFVEVDGIGIDESCHIDR